MNVPFIPSRTRAELQTPAPPGHRHYQALKVAISLLGQGLSADAVFSQLRGMYERDVGDREIRNVIAWAFARNPQSCGVGLSSRPLSQPSLQQPVRVTPAQAVRNAKDFLGDWHC